jgi:phage-related protein
MTTFNISKPDQGATKSSKTRTRVSKFGDGYEQRIGDGINSIVESWDLTFSGRTLAEIDLIDTFLEAQAGVYAFYWATPRGVTRKFKCVEWKPSYSHAFDCSLTCTFEQVFEP